MRVVVLDTLPKVVEEALLRTVLGRHHVRAQVQLLNTIVACWSNDMRSMCWVVVVVVVV